MRYLMRNSKEYRDLIIEIVAVIAVILIWEMITATPAV